jgi:hypothetical protein
VVLLVLLPLIHRYRIQAEAEIAADSTPIVSSDSTLKEQGEEPELVITPSNSDSLTMDAVAQAEQSAVLDPPASPQNQLPAHKPAVFTTSPSRLDFDLEHGIPMPTDSRGSKPAY